MAPEAPVTVLVDQLMNGGRFKMKNNGTSAQSVQLAQIPASDSNRGLSKIERAAAMYKRALIRLEAELGPNHPSVIACRKNFEILLERCGKARDCLTIASEALWKGKRVKPGAGAA